MNDFSPSRPTILVVHPKERRTKCTVEPLRTRPGFVFWKFPQAGPQSLDGYVQLHLDGPQLSIADADCGLLVLDGTWRLAATMHDRFAAVPQRSLPPWKSAYPRRSKLFGDPPDGLATIEALFIAYVILGRDTSGLLSEYRWADEFLRINQTLAGDVRDNIVPATTDGYDDGRCTVHCGKAAESRRVLYVQTDRRSMSELQDEVDSEECQCRRQEGPLSEVQAALCREAAEDSDSRRQAAGGEEAGTDETQAAGRR